MALISAVVPSLINVTSSHHDIALERNRTNLKIINHLLFQQVDFYLIYIIFSFLFISILVKDLSIIAGTNSLKEGGVIYTAKKIILHEDLSQDIALIRTTEDINFDNRIEPISITDKDYRDDGTPILITGWGSLLVSIFQILFGKL